MKRTLFLLAGIAVILAMVTPVQAAEGMKLGVGYFRPEAPVGVRLWFTDKIGGDLGIGFQSNKVLGENNALKTKVNFQLDLGLPIILAGGMAGDEATTFFFRPGFAYMKDTPSYDSEHNTWTNPKDIAVSGSLGVEHYFSKNFSLEVAHGIVYTSHDSGVSGADKDNHFSTEAFGISDVGFHYYFMAP